jgi:hypothetical protein
MAQTGMKIMPVLDDLEFGSVRDAYRGAPA